MKEHRNNLNIPACRQAGNTEHRISNIEIIENFELLIGHSIGYWIFRVPCWIFNWWL